MNVPRALRVPLLLLAAWLGLAAPSARAQYSPAPCPAYGVAQRIQGQAVAADQYAALLTRAGDQANANIQKDITHRRAIQALAKYREVVASATYGRTWQGAEALFQQAQIQQAFLKDDQGALQNYQQLTNHYQNALYPSQSLLAAQMTALETKVDHENATTPPWNIFYHLMDFLVSLTGRQTYSYPLAILFFAILLKLALTPLTVKQYEMMRKMQHLQPRIQAIKDKYKNDLQVQNQKVMELTQKEGLGTMGCLPLLIQLPVFFILLKAIYLYQYQFEHGKFLWIGSPISHQYPAILGPNLGQLDIPLLVLYAASMFVTSKLTMTPPADPAQAESQRMTMLMMPFMSTYFLWLYHVPSAFVLYYFIFNILSTIQQKYYMKVHHAGLHGEDEPGSGPDEEDAPDDAPPARPSFKTNGVKPNGLKPAGEAPTAKGVIAPARKVHPKKKRR